MITEQEQGPPSGNIAGTVSFYRTTLVNVTPTTLSGGAATLTLTTLPPGVPHINAIYRGDTDFLTSTSSAVVASVLSPDFTITSSPAEQILRPAQSVSYTISLTPANRTSVYPVRLSVSGLPSGSPLHSIHPR